MNPDVEANKSVLEAELLARNLAVSPGAWRPLERIDFSRLVHVHDHEERFLRDVLIGSLGLAVRARIARGTGLPEIQASDVQEALISLGNAVRHADAATIDPANGKIIGDICPYC